MYSLGRSLCRLRIVTCYVVLFLSIKYANCGRLSFKESLTAYAEDKTPTTEKNVQQNISEIKSFGSFLKALAHQDNAAVYQQQRENHKESHNKLNNNDMEKSESKLEPQMVAFVSNKAPTVEQPSLWQMTKNIFSSFQQNKNNSVQIPMKDFNHGEKSHDDSRYKNEHSFQPLSSIRSNDNNIPYYSPFHQPSANNGITSSSNSFFQKEIKAGVNSTNGEGKSLAQNVNQQRSKKEINTGLRELAWNTATALWSVNKVHFLPTFLHTKTGGKLSLIRESLFKPITILSQFKNGVNEINNEKLKNLARLSTGGYGWGPPVVVKLQPENSHLLTLARYIFRLTKHTTITKWKLKRALLDLQFRAIKKLIRILKSKNFAQKIATIRILSGAAWKGKRALLRLIFGGRTTTTPAPAPYSGIDNSGNVDITYSSLKQHSNQQHWMKYVNPTTPATSPLNSYYTPENYDAIQYSYDSPASLPSSEYIAPVTPPPNKPIQQYLYQVPDLGSFSSPRTQFEPPPPLIEVPSYANVLKNMGINPTNYSYDESNRVIPTPSSVQNNVGSVLLAPTPTVVYYSSSIEQDIIPQQISTVPEVQSINTIEQPVLSYSYHSSSHPLTSPSEVKLQQTSLRGENDKIIAPNTAPTSFRIKLLEAMSGGPISRRL